LNAARLFGVDVAAVRNALPKDAVGRLRLSYHEEGRRAESQVMVGGRIRAVWDLVEERKNEE
jgi:hypothetical protein